MRVDKLIEIGVDVIVIDAAQGCSKYQISMINYIKKKSSNVDVICGNVVTI